MLHTMEKIRILENGMQSEKSARVKLEARGSMVPCRRTVLQGVVVFTEYHITTATIHDMAPE